MPKPRTTESLLMWKYEIYEEKAHLLYLVLSKTTCYAMWRGPHDEVVIRIQTTDWPERSSCCAPIVLANNFPNRWPRHRKEIGADLEPRSGLLLRDTTIQVPKRMPNGNDCAKETVCCCLIRQSNRARGLVMLLRGGKKEFRNLG